MVEGREGISQKTCVDCSWTWTTKKGCTVGERWAGWRGAKGKKLVQL